VLAWYATDNGARAEKESIGEDRVGKPLALLLTRHWATVTLCDLHTRPLAEITREGDIVCSATGVAHLITADMIKPGATVVDFGFARLEVKWVGDVDFEAVKEVAGAITPVPGGTGVMTNEMLMCNVLVAAQRQCRFGARLASRRRAGSAQNTGGGEGPDRRARMSWSAG
jgi:5,10-methylene-tetrahydrofolate dehydrogenase/methenyl tetrahydrofolate cyclohydrolase